MRRSMHASSPCRTLTETDYLSANASLGQGTRKHGVPRKHTRCNSTKTAAEAPRKREGKRANTEAPPLNPAPTPETRAPLPLDTFWDLFVFATGCSRCTPSTSRCGCRSRGGGPSPPPPPRPRPRRPLLLLPTPMRTLSTATCARVQERFRFRFYCFGV